MVKLALTNEEKLKIVGRMDSNLRDAYRGKGRIMTSRNSFPLTDTERTMAYHRERNRYARDLGLPELGPEDYPKGNGGNGRESQAYPMHIGELQSTDLAAMKQQFGNRMPRANRGGRWV